MPDRVETLVRDNLPLAHHIVTRTCRRLPAHVNRDDLTSAALYALFTAARDFDPARGVPFAAYAANRIRWALADELRAADWASRPVRAQARGIGTARAALTGSLGRAPTDGEVAAAAGVATTRVTATAVAVERAAVLSLDGLTTAGVPGLLPDPQPGPELEALLSEQAAALTAAVAALPDRLRWVVQESYFAGRTHASIAAELGVTESRVSQLRTEALARLRRELTGAGMDRPLLAV